jgi:hypothetical protein
MSLTRTIKSLEAQQTIDVMNLVVSEVVKMATESKTTQVYFGKKHGLPIKISDYLDTNKIDHKHDRDYRVVTLLNGSKILSASCMEQVRGLSADRIILDGVHIAEESVLEGLKACLHTKQGELVTLTQP